MRILFKLQEVKLQTPLIEPSVKLQEVNVVSALFVQSFNVHSMNDLHSSFTTFDKVVFTILKLALTLFNAIFPLSYVQLWNKVTVSVVITVPPTLKSISLITPFLNTLNVFASSAVMAIFGLLKPIKEALLKFTSPLFESTVYRYSPCSPSPKPPSIAILR